MTVDPDYSASNIILDIKKDVAPLFPLALLHEPLYRSFVEAGGERENDRSALGSATGHT